MVNSVTIAWCAKLLNSNFYWQPPKYMATPLLYIFFPNPPLSTNFFLTISFIEIRDKHKKILVTTILGVKSS